jgi:hypothetical protein
MYWSSQPQAIGVKKIMIQGLYLLSSLVLCGSLSIAQNTEASRAKQRLLLNDPGIIQIQLAVIGSKSPSPTPDGSDVLEPFREGDKIKIRVIITNNSHEIVRVPITDTYLQNGPQLYRDGELLPYLKSIEKQKQTNEIQTDFLRTDSIVLSPGIPKAVEVLSLADWYKPLKLGHYQLTLKHRFEQGGTWIESTSVTFEIK